MSTVKEDIQDKIMSKMDVVLDCIGDDCSISDACIVAETVERLANAYKLMDEFCEL